MVKIMGHSSFTYRGIAIHIALIFIITLTLISPNYNFNQNNLFSNEQAKNDLIPSNDFKTEFDPNPFNLFQKKIFFDETHSPKYYTNHDYLDYPWGYQDFISDMTLNGYFVDNFSLGDAAPHDIIYTLNDLMAIDLLIIIEPFEFYTTYQINVIDNWFSNYGGNLLLIKDSYYNSPMVELAYNFGFGFSEEVAFEEDDYLYNDPEYVVYSGSNIKSHVINSGVNQIEYKGGSGITSYPSGTQEIIVTDNDGTAYYYDYQTETSTPTLGDPVFCAWDGLTNESGRMVVVTDSDFWANGEHGSGPIDPYINIEDHSTLAVNTIKWLLNENGALDEDYDNDSVSDYLETFRYSSDPMSNDTDTDGLLDGEEVELGTSLFDEDSDEDNLTDYEEVNTYNTNPLNMDTDSDNVTDGDEVLVYNTDPLLSDSDSDGMPDGFEIDYSFDPLNSTDADLDYDNDLLTNYAEYYYDTNPHDNDTDDDMLNDYIELFTYHTSPLKNDTDRDDLLDGEEVLIYFTNPLMRDTDGDSYWDGIEVQSGSDPLDPNSIPQEPPQKIFEPWAWSLIGVGSLIFVITITTTSILIRKAIKAKAIESELKGMINCHECNALVKPDASNCPECGSELIRCVVCKLPCTYGEKISQCSYCEAIGHYDHLLEWVEESGKCPRCLTNIGIDDLLTIE